MDSSSRSAGPARYQTNPVTGRQEIDAKATTTSGLTTDGRSVTAGRPDGVPASSTTLGTDGPGTAPTVEAVTAMVEGRNTHLLERCRQVLAATRSDESLDCALAVEGLLQRSNALGATPQAISREAQALYHQFIAVRAKKAVNLPASLRTRYEESLGDLASPEPGQSPAMAIGALRRVLGDIKAELTPFMQRNLAQRWNVPIVRDAPSLGQQPRPSVVADGGKAGLPRDSKSIEQHGIHASLRLKEERLEDFRDFLVQRKRHHFLDALEAVNALVHQDFDLSDDASRLALAKSTEAFCNQYLGEKSPFALAMDNTTEGELRDAIRKIRSAATADPEGAAETLREKMQALHQRLQGVVGRYREGFETLEKSKALGKDQRR